jgi:hypothetical protein
MWGDDPNRAWPTRRWDISTALAGGLPRELGSADSTRRTAMKVEEILVPSEGSEAWR